MITATASAKHKNCPMSYQVSLFTFILFPGLLIKENTEQLTVEQVRTVSSSLLVPPYLLLHVDEITQASCPHVPMLTSSNSCYDFNMNKKKPEETASKQVRLYPKEYGILWRLSHRKHTTIAVVIRDLIKG